jgi:hypothetical protein
MTIEGRFISPPRRSSALAASSNGENSKEKKGIMRKEGVTSFGAILLAFLATQHHNLHMFLFAIGMGGAGMSFMAAFPVVRQIMLIMSLAMVGLMLYWARDSRRPTSMRIVNVVSIVVTLGLVGWSVSQFGT